MEEEKRIRFIVFILVYLFSFSMFHRRHCNHRKLGTCSCNFSPIYIKEILRNGLPSHCFFWCLYNLSPGIESFRVKGVVYFIEAETDCFSSLEFDHRFSQV